MSEIKIKTLDLNFKTRKIKIEFKKINSLLYVRFRAFAGEVIKLADPIANIDIQNFEIKCIGLDYLGNISFFKVDRNKLYVNLPTVSFFDGNISYLLSTSDNALFNDFFNQTNRQKTLF